jgi:hypothetical protein
MMMKKTLITCFVLFLSAGLFAQDRNENNAEPKSGFRKENIFLGTGLNLGFANRSFNVGLNPEIGYSLTNWLDGGVSLNINYFSQGASDYDPTRYRNFNYGGGPFFRIWPLSFLHLQVQPEFNWINSSQKTGTTTATYNYNAGSLLLGVGYGSRIIGSQYQYITLMIDVLQNANSPYRDRYNDPLPVFRAGFGFYLNRRH